MEITNSVILALDIGLKRIGVAKAVQGIPLCLAPILRKNRNQAANAVRQLILDSHANTLVVGFPKPQNLSTHSYPNRIPQEEEILTMQRRILHFVHLLTLPPNLEVVLLDESFSSQEALGQLDDKKMRKKMHKKNGYLDSLAALVILERYLMRQK